MRHLSPSILSADFANLERDIKATTNAGAEYIHIDVMDGHFVPNITIGAPVVKAINNFSDKILDVHLMISNPSDYLDDFINAGSDIITVHIESNGDTLAQIKKIKSANIKACVAIKPKTPVNDVFDLLPYLDMVLIMTVEPGFGGQGLIPYTLDKVRTLRQKIIDCSYNCDIQVDGGVKSSNTKEVVKAGANIIVAGSAVFGTDIEKNTKEMLLAIND